MKANENHKIKTHEKRYMSAEEYIDYLEHEKHLKFKDKEKAKEIVERYGCYSVINTYKFPFKDEFNNYLEGTYFEEIYALFVFDKNIKAIFLKYLLEIEISIKAVLSNVILKEYGIKDYLKSENMDLEAKEEFKEAFIKKANDEIKLNLDRNDAVAHYNDVYGYIPSFVLVKILSFGAISRWYGLLKQSDQNKIAKYFNIKEKLFAQILKNLTFIRNICAHSERLYCCRNKKDYISFEAFKDPNYKWRKCPTNLYMVKCCMKYFLDDEEYDEFEFLLECEFNKLYLELETISIKDILKIMGFPESYFDFDYSNLGI